MQKMSKRLFEKGNQAAKKDEPALSWIQMRVTTKDKARFVRQANLDGKTLTKWAMDLMLGNSKELD